MPSIKSASRERVEQIEEDARGCQIRCEPDAYFARKRQREAERELNERGEPVNDPRW